jgi:hypothetical protein
MKKMRWLLVPLAVAMAFPASASALSPSDFKNASKFCKALRAEMGETAFRQAFGTNENRRNAHGKCVSRHASTVDDNDSNAAQRCKDERQTMGEQAFRDKYGTNKNKHNAFGKCVSKQAQEAEDNLVRAFGEAAKTCKTERGQTAASREAFRNKYGTNKNKRNAFGKCVSKLARQQHD